MKFQGWRREILKEADSLGLDKGLDVTGQGDSKGNQVSDLGYQWHHWSLEPEQLQKHSKGRKPDHSREKRD